MVIRRFKRHFHTWADILLFMRIFFWIHLTATMLKLTSFSRMLVLLTPKRNMSILASGRRALIGRVSTYTDLILGSNWWIYRMNCLKRALVIYRILRVHGIDVQICMGVRKDPSNPATDGDFDLQGHAWLMVDGQPFLEDNRSMTLTYTAVFSYPQEGATRAC